jgi:hypothetical protein
MVSAGEEYRYAPGVAASTRRNAMNRWNIPDRLEREVIERDRCCVYCGVDFTAQSASRRDRPSWEHIINDARIITRENIARCCVGCNASKGTKNLVKWLDSRYCKSRGITRKSVASVVRSALGSNA